MQAGRNLAYQISSQNQLKAFGSSKNQRKIAIGNNFTILTEAVLICLRSQARIRIRAILLGVLIGLGLAGCLVMWTNKGAVYMKQKSVMSYNAGKRCFLYFVMALYWVVTQAYRCDFIHQLGCAYGWTHRTLRVKNKAVLVPLRPLLSASEYLQ